MPTVLPRRRSTPIVLCFDLVDTLHFLWSVAQARAVQEQTKMVWQPYRDSTVLNAIYTVFRSYGEPGTVEVTQNTSRIGEQTDKYFDELTDKFLLRAADDSHPLSLAQWMELQRDIREGALDNVSAIYHDAAEIDSEIIEGTRQGIQRLAKIHLASTIALTGMSCCIGLGWVVGLSRAEVLIGGGTQIAYGIAGDIIKEWKAHTSANAIAIGAVKGGTKELVMYGAEKGADYTAEKGVQVSTSWALKYLPKLRAANSKVVRYSELVGRKLGSRKQKIALRRLSTAEAKSATVHSAARNAVRTLKAAKVVQKVVPLVFAAYDIYEAFHDYEDETQ